MTSWIVVASSVVPVAIATAYAVWVCVRALQSRSWPTVPATVLAASVVRHGSTSEPRVEYAYTIDTRRYTSRRRAVGLPLSIGGDWAARIVAAHPAGSTVDVSVDPRDPTYAVLMPGFDRAHAFTVAVVFGIVVAGAVMLAVTAGG